MLFRWNKSPTWLRRSSKACAGATTGLAYIQQLSWVFFFLEINVFVVHVYEKLFENGKEKVPSLALFSWPVSLESLGLALCCCLQSIFFSAKYEKCMSSYCQWDGHSFSPWPVLKGFVLKLCSLFVCFFSSHFWQRPMPELPAALWATSTKEFREAQLYV